MANVSTRAALVVMYGRVVYDDANVTASRRALAFSKDGGATFDSRGATTSAFPGNPGADAEGSFVQHGGTFLVGSAWGEVGPTNPGRHNFTLLASRAGADGRPTGWKAVETISPGAPPCNAPSKWELCASDARV